MESPDPLPSVDHLRLSEELAFQTEKAEHEERFKRVAADLVFKGCYLMIAPQWGYRQVQQRAYGATITQYELTSHEWVLKTELPNSRGAEKWTFKTLDELLTWLENDFWK